MDQPGRASRVVAVLLAVAIVATLTAGIVASVVVDDGPDGGTGEIAQTLADDRADRVADQVAPTAQKALTADRLRAAWNLAVSDLGAFRGVSKSYSVHESSDVQDELEVLDFAEGTGTLAAVRDSHGITGLRLLITTEPAPDVAAQAAGDATDLVSGRLADLSQHFTTEMTDRFPLARLTGITTQLLGNLRGPATVVAQTASRAGSIVVVQTELLFRNGIRRVQIAFDEQGLIAGLYLLRL